MEDLVSAEEKSRWFQELLAAQEETSAQRSQSILGSIQRVLVEESNEKRGLLAGKTEGTQTAISLEILLSLVLTST